MRRLSCMVGVLLAALSIAPLSAQETTGTIRGRVSGETSERPLQGVTVTVAGRSTVSQADGRYNLPGVPAGMQTLQARTIGYAPMTRSVTVVAGQTLELD
ncbi:MAG TPA: carboxypeptidase regulatory-like domain-containing protein, partial [Gemmatimonadales bacterium]|nr:carboxypeptidase regulatory-like domain-containing protein [Gemmatimonadales bacterium]